MNPPFLSQRAAGVTPFHVMELLARAHQLEAAGRDIIHMEVGEPDFPTPPAIVAAAQAFLGNGQVRYTGAAGLPALREAVAQWYARRFGVAVSPARILITAGASGALMLALATLTDAGDAWLLTDPGYPCNRQMVSAFNGIATDLPVGPATGFQPTAEQIGEAWTGNTRGMILASPANPTGAVATTEQLADLAEAVRARGGCMIVDEIYQGLVYEDEADTVLGIRDDVFVVNSFSKYFGMTGWRLGWLVVPAGYERAAEMLAQHYYIAASTPAQHAALQAFGPATLALLEERRHILQQRRDVLRSGIEAAGFRVDATPAGAFYLYADIAGMQSTVAGDGMQLAHHLLEEAGVAITPGIDFGTHRARQHVRLAYTTSVERIQEAVARIRAAL